jgi:hypothetical protein
MVLIAFIAVAYFVPTLLLATARRPVVVRGERFVAAVLVFGSIDTLVIATGPAVWTLGSAVFWIAHLAILPVVRNRWVLWGLDQGSARGLLENRMRMLMIDFVRVTDGYALPLANGRAAIRLSSFSRRSTILNLGGSAQRGKLPMLRTLVAKGFRPVYPRPVIQL